MKKILSILALVFVFVCVLTSCNLSFLPEKETTTPPQETIPEEPISTTSGLAYKVDGNGKTCTITGIGICTDKDIYIGDYIDGYEITAIGDDAFADCTNLTSVTIGDSVTAIGKYAFCNCTNLTSVTIGDSVNSIGEFVFGHCSNLTSITVDKNNAAYQSISGNLYSKDGTVLVTYASGKNDTNFAIPNYVSIIGSYAFYKSPHLTSVTIGDSVTTIDICAFADCTNLTNVTIGDSVTTIGKKAFSDCNNLTSVTIGDSVTKIDDYTFSCCYNLTSVTIPYSVTRIGDHAFESCYNLTSVTIPNSVTRIGEYAFRFCHDLTSVTIAIGEQSATRIGNYAFDGCYKLVEIINKSSLTIQTGSSSYGYIARYAKEVHRGTTKIVNQNDYLFYTYNGVNYLLNYVGTDTVLHLPENYNGQNYEIYQYAFRSCPDLTSVTIPESVTTIGRHAFTWCTKLENITFANPNGWQYSSSGLAISADDISNPVTAAQYLRTTYRDYYWYRTE